EKGGVHRERRDRFVSVGARRLVGVAQQGYERRVFGFVHAARRCDVGRYRQVDAILDGQVVKRLVERSVERVGERQHQRADRRLGGKSGGVVVVLWSVGQQQIHDCPGSRRLGARRGAPRADERRE